MHNPQRSLKTTTSSFKKQSSLMLRDKMVSHDQLCEGAIQVQTRLRRKLKLEGEIVFLTVSQHNCLLFTVALHPLL